MSVASCTLPCKKALSKNLQATAVVDQSSEIHVPDENMRSDTGTFFPADTSCGNFNRMTKSPQSSCLRASCTMVATRIKLTVTLAEARGWRQREVDGTQQHPEEVRVDLERERQEGTTEKTRPLPEPPWARKTVFSCSANNGRMFPSPWSCSTPRRLVLPSCPLTAKFEHIWVTEWRVGVERLWERVALPSPRPPRPFWFKPPAQPSSC